MDPVVGRVSTMNTDKAFHIYLRWSIASHILLLALIFNLVFVKFHIDIVSFVGLVLIAVIRLVGSRRSKAARREAEHQPVCEPSTQSSDIAY
jgi:hypothetical protein